MSSRLGRSTPQPLSVKPPIKQPSTGTSTPVAHLSVEEWEAKAPLDDLQIRSVAVVKSRAENIPLPYKFTDNTQRSATPIGGLATPISRPSTPLSSSRLVPGSARLQQTNLLPTHPLHTPQQFYDWFAQIDTLYIHPNSSTSAAHATDAHFRAHLEDVQARVETCDTLIGKIEEVEALVGGKGARRKSTGAGETDADADTTSVSDRRRMIDEWEAVEESGRRVEEMAQNLLQERDALVSLSNALSARLEFFTELDHATRMLNRPGTLLGENLALQSDFLDMVERVDVCIGFLEGHRQYREAEVYLLRFHQCLTRAMTLIKMYFVGCLRALQADVSKRIAATATSSSASSQTTHHLLYTRFRALTSNTSTYSNASSHTPSLRPLLTELTRRAKSYPSTLNSLLGECRSAYLGVRKALVGPVVRNEVRALIRGVAREFEGKDNSDVGPEKEALLSREARGKGSGSEVVELTRAGCTYLKEVCGEEFELFVEFFGDGTDEGEDDEAVVENGESKGTGIPGEEEVYSYLETLCDYLYDDLRPRILHEPRLSALCEVCTVLQALMVLDIDPDDGDMSDLDVNGSEDPSDYDQQKTRRHRRQSHRLHIAPLLQMILQDAQTRLFFKAQAVVQSDIRHYVPKVTTEGGGDLGYPMKLLSGSGLLTPNGNGVGEKQSVSQLWSSFSGLSSSTSNKLWAWATMENRETWYPTLKRTVWVLEQLHEFVNPAIFEDIAEEAIILCHGSLVSASEMLTHVGIASTPLPERNPAGHIISSGIDPEVMLHSTSALDGPLFLVRHLLVLREVPDRFGLAGKTETGTEKLGVSAFGGGSMRGQAGLGTSTSGSSGSLAESISLSSILGGRPAALLTSLGLGLGEGDGLGAGDGKRTIENAKRTINQSLRQACERVISSMNEDLTESLMIWVQRMRALERYGSLPSRPNPPTSNGDPSMAPEPHHADLKNLREMDDLFREQCEKELSCRVRKVWLYLGGVGGKDSKNVPGSTADARNGNDKDVDGLDERARTVGTVLIQHAQDRLAEDYGMFREMIWKSKFLSPEGGNESEIAEVRERVMDERALRKFLGGICGEM
ncbi:Golgi transport complex subunit 3 [Stygiomarasmius scandens]|uniref:Conserved oligomeric Golgi complex subunit 3 n=1 Tax=Marasmiellus scandens TaxID=2682957 RepID=A0ABR1IPF9_9AGAR